MNLYDLNDAVRELLDRAGVHEPPVDDGAALEDYDALVDDLTHAIDHRLTAYRQQAHP